MSSARCWLTFLLAVQLLAFATFSTAQRIENKPPVKLIQPSEDPTKAAWLVIGVIATTTFSVLVLWIPTILYYKYMCPKDTTTDIIKM